MGYFSNKYVWLGVWGFLVSDNSWAKFRKGLSETWDGILARWGGKRLAVLGARGVGKTHLLSFLSTGSVPSSYSWTNTRKKIPARRFQLRELDLKIRETWDVPGDEAHDVDWEELVKDADLVFYLFRIDELDNGEAVADVQKIWEWLEARGEKRPMFFLVGTFCDEINGYPGFEDEQFGSFMDKMKKSPSVKEMVAQSGGRKLAKLAIGSMKTTQETESLAYQIFSQAV